jgi:hypothetical protein
VTKKLKPNYPTAYSISNNLPTSIPVVPHSLLDPLIGAIN